MVCPECVGWCPQTWQEWGHWPSITSPGCLYNFQESWSLRGVLRASNPLPAKRPSYGFYAGPPVSREQHPHRGGGASGRKQRLLRYDWTLDKHIVSILWALWAPFANSLVQISFLGITDWLFLTDSCCLQIPSRAWLQEEPPLLS